jgi:folate-binding protein YgfZ
MVTTEAQQAVKRVRSGFGFALLDECSVLEIAGTDAPQFLQNRLTNDVLSLAPGQGQLNAVLDRQAKIQGVFGLYRDTDRFRLLIDAAEREHAVSRILQFRILEQVQVEDLSARCVVLSVQGSQSQAFLESVLDLETNETWPVQDYAWIPVKLRPGFQADQSPALPSGWLMRRGFSGELGYLLLLETDQLQQMWETFRAQASQAEGVEMTSAMLEILRVEAGIPRFGLDYDFETLLPETGLERQAVSYSKGCYLGQETVARVKTYGQVQKLLCGLRFLPDAQPPAPGSDFLIQGKPAGKITSVILSAMLERPVAMAYLGKAERIPGQLIEIEVNGKTWQAEVCLLPFYEALTPQSGQTLLEEGLKCFADGYDEEALRRLNQAIALQPDLVEAHEALGVILSRHGRYSEAIAMMEKVLALQPDHVLAHTNLSVFYMKLGDKEKAEDEKAKATLAAFSQRAKAAGLVFDIEAERRKKEQATLEKITMFQEALKFSPDDPMGNFGLGSAYMELKRYTEAIAPLERVIKGQPKHSVAYLSLGKAWEGLQDAQQAEAVYQKGIEVAAAKGDLMPLKEMQARLTGLIETKSSI